MSVNETVRLVTRRKAAEVGRGIEFHGTWKTNVRERAYQESVGPANLYVVSIGRAGEYCHAPQLEMPRIGELLTTIAARQLGLAPEHLTIGRSHEHVDDVDLFQ